MFAITSPTSTMDCPHCPWLTWQSLGQNTCVLSHPVWDVQDGTVSWTDMLYHLTSHVYVCHPVPCWTGWDSLMDRHAVWDSAYCTTSITSHIYVSRPILCMTGWDSLADRHVVPPHKSHWCVLSGWDGTASRTVHTVPSHKSCLCYVSHPVRTWWDSPYCTTTLSHVYVSHE